MKIQELSTGNWVRNNEEISQIAGILDHGDVVVRYGKHEIVYTHLSDLKPIPITLKLLNKNGFEVNEEISSGYLTIGDTRIVVELYESGTHLRIIEHCKNQLLGFEEDTIIVEERVNGVHQLQNFLTLCGIELNFEV